MSNMGYCMVRNTLSDAKQTFRAFRSGEEISIEDSEDISRLLEEYASTLRYFGIAVWDVPENEDLKRKVNVERE